MATDTAKTPGAPEEPWVEVYSSRNFAAWMAQQRVSLAFTTYQTGKLFLLGAKPDGQLAVFERTLNRCMGLWAGNDQTLWLSSLYQLWRFENALQPGAQCTRAVTGFIFRLRGLHDRRHRCATMWPWTAAGG